MKIIDLEGFVFQHAQNLGILSYLSKDIQTFYSKLNLFFDLKNYLNKTDEIINDPNLADTALTNLIKIFGNGFLDGQSFINEIVYNHQFNENEKFRNESIYFQTLYDYDIEKYNKLLISKKYLSLMQKTIKSNDNKCISIKDISDNDLLKYWDKGNFFNADMLLLKKVEDSDTCTKFELYVCDYGLMTKYYNCLSDVTYEKFKNKEKSINNFKKSNVSFSKINISSNLKNNSIVKKIPDYLNFLNPMGSKEKWFLKLVQAGSYACSFIDFLINHTDFFESGLTIEKIVFGSKTGVSKSFLPITTKGVAPTEIKTSLQKYLNAYVESKKNEHSFELTDLYGTMNNKLNELYPDQDINIFNMIGTNEETCLYKEISNYNNINEERDQHSNNVKKVLTDVNIDEIWLLGCPGIGKTTAITQFLIEKEKFLFFYSSPRTSVNTEVALNKFGNSKNKLNFNDNDNNLKNIVSINCDSKDPSRLNNGKQVKIIKFNANDDKIKDTLLKYKKHSFELIDFKNIEDKPFNSNSNKFKSIGEQKYLRDKNNDGNGVLKRLCEFTKCVTNEKNLPIEGLAVTCSTQSLKKVNASNTVEQNINSIFDFINSSNILNIDKYIDFVSKWPIIIFAIDEITGDKHGAIFYNILKNVLKKTKKIINNCNRLSDEQKKLFNIKLIVADASITSSPACKKHIINNINSSNINSSMPKIYYEEINEKENSFIIDGNVAYINAFTFPASKIKYETHVVSPETSDEYPDKSNLLKSISNRTIKYLQDHPNNEQVIIFIQNIEDNDKLKNLLLENKTIKLEDNEIQIINSKMSFDEKINLKNSEFIKKKIFIMTSSASRGIDFPLATGIIAEIPAFNIEMNLAEINQLIYRGRGNINVGNERLNYEGREHSLIFYLYAPIHISKDQIKENRTISKLYQSISTISMLFILQANIYTRIFGKFKFNNKCYEIIPLGDIGIDNIAKSDYIRNINNLKIIMSEIKAHAENVQYFGGPKVKQEISDTEQILYNFVTYANSNILNKNFKSSIQNISQYNYYDDLYNRIISSSTGRELFDNLINFNPFNDAYVEDNMIFVKINYGDMVIFQRNNVDKLKEILSYKLFTNKVNPEIFNRDFVIAINELKNYINLVIDSIENQNEDFDLLDKQDDDLYYVCFANITQKEINELNKLCETNAVSFTSGNTKDNNSIDNIIAQRIKTITPVSAQYLPNLSKVDKNFKNCFPFTLISAPELKEIFSKEFKCENIYNSLNCNVINLMLLSNEE